MSDDAGDSTLQDRTLILLTVVVSLAFAWILWPFYGAILWATILAIVFAPVQRRLLAAMPGRRNLAALVTLLIIVGIVLLPLALTAGSLANEASSLYERVQSGQLNLGRILQRFLEALPGWASSLLNRFGVDDAGDIQQRVTALLKEGSQFFASQAMLVGQGTANLLISAFIMLYLLYFLLRDGGRLATRIKAMPDYVVLISTLGGIVIFGLNGFVVGPLIAAMFIAVWGISSGAAAPPQEPDEAP